MPGNTPMRYPFPYKTQDGVVEGGGVTDPLVVDELIVNEGVTINGDGDALTVNGNAKITGDLYLEGNLIGTVLPPSMTTPFYTATDSTDQYRVSAGPNFDLTTTNSTHPTVYIKNYQGTTINSTLVARRVRSASDAFGLDLESQGSGKSIRLATDDSTRVTVSDVGVVVAQDLNVAGVVYTGGTVSSTQFLSRVGTGTAPLSVNSTTLVSNLNANLLNGGTFSSPGSIGNTTPSTGNFTTVTASNYVSAPTLKFSYGNGGIEINNGYTNSAVLRCLNDGGITGDGTYIYTPGNYSSSNYVLALSPTLAIFPANLSIQGTTTSVGAITSPRFYSTVGTGVSPFSVISSTVVTNLNANYLNGATFESPGPVGGTTSSSGRFTTGNFSGDVVISSPTNSVSKATGGLVVDGGLGVSGNLYVGSNVTIDGGLTLAQGLTISSLTVNGPLVVSGNTNINGDLNVGEKISLSASTGVITLTQTTAAPFIVSSSVLVPNLNANKLNGATFASPGVIGGTAASSAIFTNVLMTSGESETFITNWITFKGGTGAPGFEIYRSGDNYLTYNSATFHRFMIDGGVKVVIGAGGLDIAGSLSVAGTVQGTTLISTNGTGTAPLSISSTTVVTNLNANYLNGATFQAPGIIGGGVASSATFTSASVLGNLLVGGNLNVGGNLFY